jgi:hypothetical protein
MEMSLEDKLQAKFDQMLADKVLDRNHKYYFFYWLIEDMKAICRIVANSDEPQFNLSEQELKWVDEKKFVILEYSNKRSRWELSVPGK